MNRITNSARSITTFFFLFMLLSASIIISPLLMRSGIISFEKAYAVSSSTTTTSTSSHSSSTHIPISGSQYSSYPTTTSSPTTTSTSPTTTTAPSASTSTTKPTANPTSVSTPKNTAKAIQLTGSGSSPLTFFITTNPSHGTLGPISSAGSSASVTYTPNTNFAGSDSFSFKVMDTVTGKTSSSAKVSITVVNQPPTAFGQTLSTTSGQSVNIQLQATDPDPGDKIVKYSMVSTTNVKNGKLSNFNTQTGTVTYTANSAITVLKTDSFSFQAFDTSQAASNTAIVTINISPVNNPPPKPAAPVISTTGFATKESSFSISGTEEAGSTVQLLDNHVTVSGAHTIAGADRSWSITLSNVAEGIHTYTATATNAGGTSTESNSVTITVDRTGPAAPVITSPADGTTTNAATIDIAGTAANDAVSVQVSIDGQTFGGKIAVSSGAWSVSGADISGLSDGPHTLTAIAYDSLNNPGSASAAITLNIDRTGPAAPVITSPADGSITNAQRSYIHEEI